MAILDGQAVYRFANWQHTSWFSLEPEALVSRPAAEVMGESAWALLHDAYKRALAGETASYTGMVPFLHGGERFVQATAMALQTGDGNTDSVLVLCTDLTELVRVRRELDESSVRSQTILDTAVDSIVTIDENGIVQSCNTSTERLFGYTAEEMVGNNVNMLMPPKYAAEHDEYLGHYLRTGEKRIIGIGREVTARRKDGSEFPIHLAVGEFIEQGRHYFTGFVRDMTLQKEAERSARAHLEQLAHVSRLNAIDNLASGLSHEVNQPLTAIVTMSQALLRSLRAGKNDPARLEDTLERIVQQGARANAVVQQMREHARRDTSVEQSPHHLDEIIVGVLKLLEYEINQHHIDVWTELETAGKPIVINRIQIEQVLLNLVQNAVHAMTEVSGERALTVSSRLSVDKSPWVEVLVSDTGVGLPTEREAEVFDPFFTTKEQGMGQGLAISRSIIESHGGFLVGGNNNAGGALFKFTLPADGVSEGSDG